MSVYRYTVNNKAISDTERLFYENNGYLIVRNLVPVELLEEFKQRFVDIANGKVDPGFLRIVKDPSLKKKGLQGEHVINKLQEILYEDVLWKYFIYEPIVNIVADIIGDNITAAHSMLINKPPDADRATSLHPFHQDLHYFPFRPADRVVASWTAIDRADEDNGCLFGIPGTHKGSLYRHGYPEGTQHQLYHGVTEMHKVHGEKINFVMNPGDTVFFHPLLLHGSGPNKTKNYRRCISGHFADTNAIFINLEGTSQEHIAKEIVTTAIKYGLPMNFTNIWKMKSRLVKGAEGNFQNLDSHI